MRRTLALLVLAAAGVLAAPRAAEACSCLQLNARCGAAGAFWETPAVFVGRVVSIESATSQPVRRFFGRRKVRMRVVEGFRGTPGGHPEISVLTGGGGGDCGYPFKVGGEYLVYASRHEESGELTTGTCSRTRKAEDASTDIEYARQVLAGKAQAGRVLGEVWLRTRDLGGAPRAPDRPVAGVRVQLAQSGSVITAVSDEHGGFVVEGLAAGVYKVSAQAPAGYVASAVDDEIDVPHSQSCVTADVTVAYDGRIRGRVVDARGRGVASVAVQALASVSRDKLLAEYVGATTLDDGTYEMTAVPPGRFVVGINIRRDSEDETAEPRIFHPGVTSSRAALILRLNPSEQLTIGDLVLPDSITFVQLRGLVVDTAGVPVFGASVYLKRDGDRGHVIEMTGTNNRGEFVMAALAGRRYRIFAEYTGNDRKVNVWHSSEAIPIEPSPGMPPLKLVVRRQY